MKDKEGYKIILPIIRGRIQKMEEEIPPRILCSLLVEFWRLKRRLSEFQKQNVESDLSRVLEEIERMDDILVNEDIKIKDYSGQSYENGMSVKVIYTEKDTEKKEGSCLISETIKPTIYYKGKVLVLGEVIIGKK